MKGGLCLVYTSLLTISVLSSCALFMLVVSEALQPDVNANTTVDINGLQNVSQKDSTVSDSLGIIPSDELDPEHANKLPAFGDSELTFAEALSLNSVTTEGLPDTGQPPILITLADNAKLDIQNSEELFSNNSELHNDTQTFSRIESGEDKDEDEKDSPSAEKTKVDSANSPEPTLVKAKLMHEAKQTNEAFFPSSSTKAPPQVFEQTAESLDEKTENKNSSGSDNVQAKPETPNEDIPSFSEWAQKQLAEAEKQDTVMNHSSQPSHSNTNFNNKSTKLRTKNYASPACGSKIVAVNPEAGSASAILSPNRDEYMLNTCNSRIWFVVELCEAVQAQKIELANFELFSSIPKDFSVSFSDRFPTREWTSVGQFTAKDERDIQSFDLYPHLFGKFIKIEILTYYGSEHYCPISLFKVYGTSEFEVLEKESSEHVPQIDDDDEILGDVPDVPNTETEVSKNLFGSARDAVMSIMKKAAQVLVKSEVPKNASCANNDTTADTYRKCCSPSHIIVCDNCSEALYSDVFDLISCDSNKLINLLHHVFIEDTLKFTGICQPFGLDFISKKTISFRNERATYLTAIFSKKYIAALCNMLAIMEKKVVLNTSYETEKTSSNLTDEPSNDTVENNFIHGVKLSTKDNVSAEGGDTLTEDINNSVSDDPQLLQDNYTDSNNDNEEISDDSKNKIDPNQPTTSDEKMKPENENITYDESVIENITDNSNTVEIIPTDPNSGDATKTEPTKSGNSEADLVEKIHNGNIGEEMNDQIVIDNDNFMSELDQLTVDPTPPGIQGAISPNSQNNQGQAIPKESVFLRLSNRVKVLERNMSLSGQYLEELSRRYKKQVEEMQKTFEKTVLQMTEERRKSSEREQKYTEHMVYLQEQLAQLNTVTKVLMDDRDSWFGNMTFLKFVFLQIIIILLVLYYVNKKQNAEQLPVAKKSSKNKKNQDKGKQRRKSVEGVSGHETPASKKRRPSEEALQIARQAAEEAALEGEEEGDWQVAKKNRRRKSSILHRNIQINEASCTPDWHRQDSLGNLQENIIPLDDDEFIAPVSEPVEFNGTSDIQKNPPKKEFPKTNGSILNNIKAKTGKRRLSSPAFFRSALSRQSSRSTPSPLVLTPEPSLNGKADKKSGRATSESPSGSLWSNSPDNLVNGQCESETSSVKQSKRKSFKNIFKKVF